MYFEAENVAKQADFIRNRSGENIQFFLVPDSFSYPETQKKTKTGKYIFPS